MSKQDSGGQMNSSKLAVVILAGAKDKRFNTRRPKELYNVGGRPLLGHSIAAASRVASFADVFVVTGRETQQIRDAVAGTGVQIVEQAQGQTGADALRGAIAGYDNVAVVPSDMPLLRGETIAQLLQMHIAAGFAMSKLITREGGAGEPESDTGVYAFKAKELAAHLDKLKAKKTDGHLDLGGMDAVLRAAGSVVAVTPVDNADELLRVRSVADLVALDLKVRTAIAEQWMEKGVIIYRPETCVIDAEVAIEPDTILEPFVQLLGRTKVGSGCHIRSYSVLENCVLGNEVIIRPHCVLTDSSIADRAEIGPFARMRPGCEVGEQVHIGNFVELKKAKLGKGVKAGHLSYLGDTEIGEDVNIGAGVITCNYDGVHKHLTRIGDGAFVGSDSTLVAPVTIGKGAYVGAASCITKEVPADALAVGRAPQVVKEGWAAERRARRKAQTAKKE